MNTIYAAALTSEIIDLQLSISNATDYAAGVLLGDLRKLLSEYATANFVIIRCHCGYWPVDHIVLCHLLDRCLNCQESMERLLADGTWQSETERQIENLNQYRKESGK